MPFDKSALTDIAIALGFRSKQGFLYFERGKKFITDKSGKKVAFLKVVGFQKGKVFIQNNDGKVEEISY